MFPDAALSERLARAQRAVRELLHADLVRLYQGSWADGDQTEVPSHGAEAILREWRSWVATNEGPLTFFLATDEGVRASGIRSA